jgi:hypothetical protein
MYAVTIKWANGTVTRAVVNRDALKTFNLKACNGAAVSWRKLS